VSAIGHTVSELLYAIARGFRLSPAAMVGILFPIVPIAIALPRVRSLPPPLRWALAYLVVTLAEDMFMIVWSRHGRHNLWIMNLYTPVEAFILGMMFAGWQLRERWRTTIYITIAVLVVFWGVMMLEVEGLDSFPQFSKPVQSLLVMAAATWTLVQRSRVAVSPLTRHPWFWISVGTLLYFAYLMLLDPVGTVLSQHQKDLFELAYAINGILVTAMYLFWIRAFLLVPRRAERGAPA
jgi:hypothetical protein